GIFLFRLVASRTLTGFHMVVGITVLLLMTARFFVRIFTRHPARASTGSKMLDLAGDLTHYALYVLVIVVTAFGILFAGESGLTQSILFKAMPSGGGLIGSLQLWGIPLITYHRFAAYALLGLILLHIGAAGFHELVLKDRLISRMWFRRGNN
ncbi:MAG: cytochrome b/b6 domain-containing protein, partial [Anaerolineaceae bacterium]